MDEVVLSEASGAEDSPALTEASDYPNDTPEADHRIDANTGAPMMPLKIDKATRYGRSGLPLKKHASGKGEIRLHRELSIGARKRKRHNLDRDVGSVARHYQAQDSDAWDSDSDTSVGPRSSRRSQGKDTQNKQKGAFELFFHFLNKYPNAPDHMQRWMQFGANLFLVSVVAYLGWSVVSTVRNDIYRANEIARQELMSKMTECQTEYTMNKCADKDRPGLRLMCEEWYECMTQNPESILRVKVTAKQVAEIINEFSETMHLKAWVWLSRLCISQAVDANYVTGCRACFHLGLHDCQRGVTRATERAQDSPFCAGTNEPRGSRHGQVPRDHAGIHVGAGSDTEDATPRDAG